jgi:hypothetical protein
VSVLCHLLERAGLATVGISLVRQQAVNVAPPRILHCQFPLGRPLGRPGDGAFQREVIGAAFALLDRTDLPVIEDFPVEITDVPTAPDSCPLPARYDPDLPPAIDEARGLRNAYDRNLAECGRTAMGRVAGPDGIGDLIEVLLQIDAGRSLDELGIDDARLVAIGQDVRAYYEEAALQLADSTGARQLEYWFYTTTEAGRLLTRVRDRLRAAGTNKLAAGYVVPRSQG